MVEALVKGRAACAQSLPTTIDIMAPNTNKATVLRVSTPSRTNGATGLRLINMPRFQHALHASFEVLATE